MNIKNKIWAMCMMMLPLAFTSCEDYFDTDPKNTINESDYIAEEDEMYKGFLGILNRVQEAGDHAIFLTDTRMPLLKTTDAAPTELKTIYNYGATEGNSYADPTCYYAIIVACNDYFNKMEEFYNNVGGMTEYAEANYKPLVSSAMRLKAWAYLMLGKTYGEAYWFDDPLTEKKDLSDTSVFTYCTMKELSDKAINLLENGMTIAGNQIPANLDINWVTWLDPEDQEAALYQKWTYVTPPNYILQAEFRSWRASYDAAGGQADWEWIRNTILDETYPLQTAADERCADLIAEGSEGYIYQLTKLLQSDAGGTYFRMFYSEEIDLKYQLISTILYDYKNEQRNRLVQYFCPEYPDADSYYLSPSEYGISLYNSSDIRGLDQKWMMNTLGGDVCVSKYYYGYNYTERSYEYLNKTPIYKIQPAIPTFRSHDLHFLLAEAEANLGNFEIAYHILNNGLSGALPDKIAPAHWDPRYQPWYNNNAGGYGNIGIVGVAAGKVYDNLIYKPEDVAKLNETQIDSLKQAYSWALADEHIKEYIAEGKSHGFLCKVAERYANSATGNAEAAKDSVINRLTPKYPAAVQQQVEATLNNDKGYFIKWNLSEL